MGLVRNVSFLIYGTKHFGKDGYARASKSFDNSVMARRLDGKVVLVTGANQGIGYKASEELAARGCTLYMACRSQERGEEAVRRVREATGNQDVHLQVCDVSSLSSIDALVHDWEASGRALHVLVNNAGVLINENTQKSADGYDINFATNTLGAFALTWALGGVLRRSAPSSVIFVSSGGMYTECLEVKHLLNEDMRKYDGAAAYARDKRRQVALTERFAEAWGDAGVRVYAMHPGWTTTEGVKKSIPGFYSTFQDKFRELGQGADTIVYLALQEPSKLENGGFYLDRTPQPKHLALAGTAYSRAPVDQLWSALEGMCSGKVHQAQ